MKTTIAVLFSVFLILPGIKKSARQSADDVNKADISFTLIQRLNPNEWTNISQFYDIKVNTFGPEKLTGSEWIDSEKKMETDLSIEEWMKDPENWIQKPLPEIDINTDEFVLQFIDDMYREVDPVIEKWMTEPHKWTDRKQSANF